MLKQRIATAIVLVGLVLGSFIWFPSSKLALALGLFFLIGAWEWTRLAGIKSFVGKIIYVALMAVAAWIVLISVKQEPSIIKVVTGLALFWWVIALFSLIGAGRLFMFRAFQLASGFIVLIAPWISAIYLHSQGGQYLYIVLFIFVIVGAADSAAFFVGRKWGKTKLAPTISPGKSIEGLAGGMLAVLSVAILYGIYVLHFSDRMLLVFAGVSIVTGLFSVVGDLVESKLKRQAGVKDSGRILPGHGGVLDRIDAFTAAAPVYTLLWVYAFPVTN
ncbi:MAG: phosphatidate cytidylyltransferase [Gammaproteobacteria bacterium]|nr:phosphatidate cytidylyltransferase [Gammaproteobacteria bacterium]